MVTRAHWVLVVACTAALQQEAVCRRFLLRGVGALLPGIGCADDLPRLKASLLASIQLSPSGSPATNLSIPRHASAVIEALALQLERKRSVVAPDLVDGSWRLVYSNAPEITSLVSLPLGFELGPVFQPFNVSSGAFENQALIGHKLGLARANTRVVGEFTPAGGRRFDVTFRRVIFQLDAPFYSRKVVSPQVAPDKPPPFVEITFLDSDLRITRGGDGALFVLLKQPSPMRMLEDNERLLLYDDTLNAEEVVAGAGLANWSESTKNGAFGRWHV